LKMLHRKENNPMMKTSSVEEEDDELMMRNLKKIRLDSYDCKNCDKRFTRQDNLVRHVKGAHQATKYSCPKCNRKYARKDYLTRHMKKKAH
jgi:uncharacterized Zn-finger protein